MALLSTTVLLSDYLPGVKSTETDLVAVLGRALARVEILMATHLGFPGTSPTWESTSTVLRLRATGDTSELTIPHGAVATIVSTAGSPTVYQDTDLAFGSSTVVLSSYWEQEDNRSHSILHLLPTASVTAWYTAKRSIKVTCTIGYAAEADVPKPLADAAYRWVADWYLRRGGRHIAASANQGSSVNFTTLEAVPADVEPVIGTWRHLAAVVG